MKHFKEQFIAKFQHESYVVQQKAFVLFLIAVMCIPILLIPTVVNYYTSVSTHPMAINLLNGIALAGTLASLLLLWEGRYKVSVLVINALIIFRVAGGMAVKIEDVATMGSNNNAYFIFIALAFASLFGGRRILVFMAVAFAAVCAAGIPVISWHYPSADMNRLYGSVINIVLAIAGVSFLLHLIASITEKMFEQINIEFEAKKNLSENMALKVQELEAMYEEVESMNEELSHTYGELLEANKEISIFKKFIEEAGQGFCMTDMDGVINYANPAIVSIMGKRDKQAVIGTSTRDYYTKDTRARIKNEIMPRVRSEGQWLGELYVLNSRGDEIPTLQNIFFIRDEKGEPAYVATIVSDITEMKKLEDKLMLAHKMDALGRLTGGIAHDYNNVLTAILGFSQILKSEIGPDDPRAQLVDEIIKAGHISAGITRQLLAFSKNQFLKPMVIDLNVSIRNLEKMLRRFTGESIALVLRLDPDVRTIFADPAQIDQVVLNLVINACDAMPTAGTLFIETGNADIDSYAAERAPEARAGQYAFVSIEDTGAGMDKDKMDHMFEPFFSTKSSGKGTGLGLSVVYGIVKQHGGWINAYSEPGKGTRIKVYIPAASGESVAAASVPETKQELSGSGERILLVEDHQNVRDFASRILREHGYTVIEAEDAERALSRFNQDGGNFDMLLSDVVLPGKNGIHLAEEITALNPRVTVLLSSGYTGQRSQIDAILEKQYPFLQKPYSMIDLLQSVHMTLHRKP